MADDVSVEIVAKIDRLQSGLDQAVSSLKGSFDEIKSGFKSTGDQGKETEGLLKTVLSGAAFLEFKEIATEALHGVQEALEATAGKAEEFGLNNAKFAKMMGTSSEEAAGLSAALKGVGSSAEQYESMAMRMEMRLKSNETALRSYGMATRDANGNLLSGQGLMQSAIGTMEQYKSGTDQNEFALQVFGRRAADVYDIMRITKAQQEQYIEDMKKLGVETDDSSGKAQEYEEAQARLKQQYEDVMIALGQKLMPVMTRFFNGLSEGAGMFQTVETVIKSLITTFSLLETAFIALGLLIGGVLTEIVEMAFYTGRVIGDVLSLKWGNIGNDIKAGWDDMKDTFHKTMEHMANDAQGFMNTYHAMWDKPAAPEKPEPSAYGAGGNRTFQAYDKSAGKEAQKLADEIIQARMRMALEEVKIDEDKNNHLLQMGQETLDEFLAKQVQYENRKYQIQQEALEKKAQEDSKDKVAHQKDLDALKLLDETHQAALNRINQSGEEKRAQLSKQETQNYITDQENQLTNDIEALNTSYQRHLITDEEKAAAERKLTAETEKNIMDRLDAEMAATKRGTTDWNTLYRQKLQIAQKFQQDMTKIDNELYNSEHQKWQQLEQSIRSSFNSALNGMILGTMSWKQALGQVIDAVANSFLEMGEKILEDWVETQVEKAIVTQSTDTTSALGQIQAAAGVAAANTFAAIAAIPVVGPELAPGAAAASFATVMSFQGLAFAAQGMLLDRDRLVFAHKDEQILPAHLSRGIIDLVKGGGGKGDINLHYGPQISNPQAKSLDQMLHEESSTMMAWLLARQRDGSFRARAA